MKRIDRGLFDVLLRDIRRGIEEIHETSHQSPGQNSNSRPTEYKAGTLIIFHYFKNE